MQGPLEARTEEARRFVMRGTLSPPRRREIRVQIDTDFSMSVSMAIPTSP